MAFSMFLRNTGCTNRAFSQQVMKLATQSLTQRSVASTLPIRSQTLTQATSPNMIAMRSLRTSFVPMSARLPHDEKEHDHAKLWVIEKLTSAALVPLIPLALAMPNKILDAAVAILITAHTFWGLEAIAVDYVRASVFGPLIPKIALGLVYALSIATLGGLFYVISHDIGIANTVRAVWAIKSDQRA